MGLLSLQRDDTGPRQDIYHRGHGQGLGVAVSPDGIHWTLINGWATEGICDGAKQARAHSFGAQTIQECRGVYPPPATGRPDTVQRSPFSFLAAE